MTTIDKQAAEILGYEAGHEFWRSGAAKGIVDTYKALLAHGLSQPAAKTAIQSIWDIACAEYGN